MRPWFHVSFRMWYLCQCNSQPRFFCSSPWHETFWDMEWCQLNDSWLFWPQIAMIRSYWWLPLLLYLKEQWKKQRGHKENCKKEKKLDQQCDNTDNANRHYIYYMLQDWLLLNIFLRYFLFKLLLFIIVPSLRNQIDCGYKAVISPSCHWCRWNT